MTDAIKWTLVTGGAKRLGAAICRKLAQSGHPLVIHYNISLEEAKTLQKECRGYGVPVEIIQGSFTTFASTDEFLSRYIKQFPSTKNLINNVGSYLLAHIEETNPEDAYKLFQTNFFTPFLLVQKLLPAIKQENGSIINLGISGLAGPKANVGSPIYFATKAALWSLTKSLAKELAPHAVRVNMVSPGLLENAIDLEKNPNLLKQVPMGHTGKLVDVATTIDFLLTDASNYITGQNIEIAGGLGL
jgi:NAD(P)-dependent dehydrogenase (short-subunit alcohol dehydrogenase family)